MSSLQNEGIFTHSWVLVSGPSDPDSYSEMASSSEGDGSPLFSVSGTSNLSAGMPYFTASSSGALLQHQRTVRAAELKIVSEHVFTKW